MKSVTAFWVHLQKETYTVATRIEAFNEVVVRTVFKPTSGAWRISPFFFFFRATWLGQLDGLIQVLLNGRVFKLYCVKISIQNLPTAPTTMPISRDEYDHKPFLIRQGALRLWGVLLAHRVDLCRIRELYSLSDFFAELCYDKVTGEPTCICSFTGTGRTELYMKELDLNALTQHL